jgi:hypothetical protein
MSEWVAFVKKYSADNNLTYREALKQASKPYRESKGLPAKKDGPPKVKKPRKKKVKVEVDVAVDQQGEGVKEIVERIKDVVLLRDDPEGSPSVRANMKKYGDIKIKSIQVCRQPISRMLRTLLNITTLGGVEKYLKSHSHDELFHLYLVATLQDGTRLQIEKNERVDISTKIRKITAKGSCMDVPGNTSGITLGDLINKTKAQMGKDFFIYQSATSNCQGFVSAVLRANNLMTGELNGFINQDTLKIFKRAPWASKIANFITDIAKGIDIAIRGKGVE